MDEAINKDEREAGGSPVGGLLDSLLKNPELISKLSGIISGLNNPENSQSPDTQAMGGGDAGENPLSSEKTEELSKKLSSFLENKELMSMLPGLLSVLRSPSSSDSLPAGIAHGGDHHGHHKRAGWDKKIALLCALKPYMSGRRREMIDYLIRINKLSDIFNNIT